jgi:AmmeMemoRadiSam system protein B
LTRVLGPVVAGRWYPADGGSLGREIDRLIDDAGRAGADAGRSPGAVRALLAPHAGYVYSGAVAARGFRQILGESYDRVVLLGPSHYAAYAGAAMPDAERYRTPLGEIELDTACIAELSARPGLHVDGAPFEPEHSLEMEIPFLQRTLAPGWKLLPLLIGATSSADDLNRVAEALAPLVGPGLLLVVSSDLTHFGQAFRYQPFDKDVPARIEALDMGAVQRMLALDATGFASYVRETGATICGRMAIDVLLRTLPPDSVGRLEAYDTSGRITGDWESSVSYASVVFCETGGADATARGGTARWS